MGVCFPRRSNERGHTRPRCGFASFYSSLVQIENDSHACIGRDARARDRASSVAGALLLYNITVQRCSKRWTKGCVNLSLRPEPEAGRQPDAVSHMTQPRAICLTISLRHRGGAQPKISGQGGRERPAVRCSTGRERADKQIEPSSVGKLKFCRPC